jgi:GYF domain 2
MNDWFYTKERQQHGPVNLLNLQMMIREGRLNPAEDLAWNSSMSDWLPISQIPELHVQLEQHTPNPGASSQPFAYPIGTGPIQEIEPGSERIMATACLKRAWDLTIRHIGPLMLATIIFVAIAILTELSLKQLDKGMGWRNPGQVLVDEMGVTEDQKLVYRSAFQDQLSLPSSILSMVIHVFLALGATRLALNIVSGEKFSVGMLFGGAPLLIKGFFAHLLYWIMVTVGLVLFIFPGVYLAIRFGMAQTAIVDKNMGLIEAFKYSSKITKNNRLELFLIFIFMFGITIAGCIALIVGLLFAYPLMFLMWIVAYRWLQFGARAIMDDPTTGTPLLAGQTEKTTEPSV